MTSTQEMHPQQEQLHTRYQEAVKKELDELKVLGILVPSTSPWGSPIVLVAKKDGGGESLRGLQESKQNHG